MGRHATTGYLVGQLVWVVEVWTAVRIAALQAQHSSSSECRRGWGGGMCGFIMKSKRCRWVVVARIICVLSVSETICITSSVLCVCLTVPVTAPMVLWVGTYGLLVRALTPVAGDSTVWWWTAGG